MNRDNSKLIAHLKAAKAYAELSYAKRLKVGAVIVRDDRIVSIGYNGLPAGASNVCEWLINKKYPTHPISIKKRKLTDEEIDILIEGGDFELKTKPEVVHAESNAIAYAARNGIKTENCSMIVTHSTCFECAKIIIQAGIKSVYYGEEYRDLSPIGFLSSRGIYTKKIEVNYE